MDITEINDADIVCRLILKFLFIFLCRGHRDSANMDQRDEVQRTRPCTRPTQYSMGYNEPLLTNYCGALFFFKN